MKERDTTESRLACLVIAQFLCCRFIASHFHLLLKTTVVFIIADNFYDQYGLLRGLHIIACTRQGVVLPPPPSPPPLPILRLGTKFKIPMRLHTINVSQSLFIIIKLRNYPDPCFLSILVLAYCPSIIQLINEKDTTDSPSEGLVIMHILRSLLAQ